jgi:hypothetical protein
MWGDHKRVAVLKKKKPMDLIKNSMRPGLVLRPNVVDMSQRAAMSNQKFRPSSANMILRFRN